MKKKVSQIKNTLVKKIGKNLDKMRKNSKRDPKQMLNLVKKYATIISVKSSFIYRYYSFA